ncbi:MAG: FtsW/RodA/SpoVE family cell cycle protein [Bacteroidales bacterium]|nr:FtsW/RodA/SpoVE family cell cycle protein [Bacteroidales bacterium]
MGIFFRHIFKGDKWIWIIFAFLAIISILEVFSATSTLAYRASEYWRPWYTHTMSIVTGMIGMIIVQNIPPHKFKVLGFISVVAAVFLLIAVMFTAEVNGAQRQILGIQPSELGKFGLITFVSFLLSKGKSEEGITKQTLWYILLFSGIICGLIAPENFSTAGLLAIVIFLMMIVAQVQWKWLLSLAGIAVVCVSLFLGVLVLTPMDKLPGRMATWKSRIELSMESSKTPLVSQKIDDKNRQVQYGRMAVANGLIGKGPGNSQIRDFLPQAYSDYIYSIIIEELGFVIGGIGTLILYLGLMFRVGRIFSKCKYVFPGFLLLGLTMIIVFQALINMAVGVDLIPVTGQPLPLVSRGRNSMYFTCLYFGIILSISRSVGIGEEDYDDNHLAGEPSAESLEIENNSDEALSDNVSQNVKQEVYETEEI